MLCNRALFYRSLKRMSQSRPQGLLVISTAEKTLGKRLRMRTAGFWRAEAHGARNGDDSVKFEAFEGVVLVCCSCVLADQHQDSVLSGCSCRFKMPVTSRNLIIVSSSVHRLLLPEAIRSRVTPRPGIAEYIDSFYS